MKIFSFNVNSIRARHHQLLRLVEKHQPDLICLQETKVVDDVFPLQDTEKLGYKALIHGQKGHYGVAILAREEPMECLYGMPEDSESEQKRLIRARFDTASGPIWVFNGYFPQGENRSHPVKFPYKKKFYQRLTELLRQHHRPDERLIVLGDLNIAPSELDIGIGESNRLRWLQSGYCCFLPEEREWLQTLTSWGLTDTWRHQNPTQDDLFSWFDYRSRGFEDNPKRGLRIDQIWVSAPLLPTLRATGIDYEIRAMEKPSDHCPIWAEFAL